MGHGVPAVSEGVFIMASEYAVSADNARHHAGTPYGVPENHRERQERKLSALMKALEQGDLDAARQAFVALVHFVPAAENDPTLGMIGAALQSSNLHSARYFAKSLSTPERPILAARWWTGPKMAASAAVLKNQVGVLKVDFRA
jgi:hypothetical protein